MDIEAPGGDLGVARSVDRSTPIDRPHSRRALLAGLLGGAGAWALTAVGRVSPVQAVGETMVVGGSYPAATSTTVLTNSANSSTVLFASSGSGVGVGGVSQSSRGVVGLSDTGTGVFGQSDGSGKGVEARSLTNRALDARSESGWGVYGRSDSSHGVHGSGQSATGVGVYGESSAGIALTGVTSTGYALRTSGRLKAEKVSGVARMAKGSTSVTVAPGVDVTSGSFVLLTPKANIGSRGLWYSIDATNNRFTIRLSSSRSSSTPVAWLLLG